MAALQVAVRVPGAGAAVAAVEDLDEAHAALHQPPRRQALLPERARHVVIQTIELARRGALLLKLEYFRHGGLHAEGQLIGLDARTQRRVVRIIDAGQAIEPA